MVVSRVLQLRTYVVRYTNSYHEFIFAIYVVVVNCQVSSEVAGQIQWPIPKQNRFIKNQTWPIDLSSQTRSFCNSKGRIVVSTVH